MFSPFFPFFPIFILLYGLLAPNLTAQTTLFADEFNDGIQPQNQGWSLSFNNVMIWRFQEANGNWEITHMVDRMVAGHGLCLNHFHERSAVGNRLTQEDPLVVLRVANDVQQAHVLVATLKAAGIESVIHNEALHGIMGEVPLGWSTLPRLLVRQSEAESANRVLHTNISN